MKIVVTKVEHEEIADKFHFEVCVRVDGINQCCYAFNTKQEVEAFCSGFQVAKTISNNLIQSMPVGYELKK